MLQQEKIPVFQTEKKYSIKKETSTQRTSFAIKRIKDSLDKKILQPLEQETYLDIQCVAPGSSPWSAVFNVRDLLAITD